MRSRPSTVPLLLETTARSRAPEPSSSDRWPRRPAGSIGRSTPFGPRARPSSSSRTGSSCRSGPVDLLAGDGPASSRTTRTRPGACSRGCSRRSAPVSSSAPDFELKLLVGLAITEAYRGAHDAAVGYLEEARALSTDLDDRRRGIVLVNLANGYRGAGDNEAAIRYGGQALDAAPGRRGRAQTAMLENNLALAYLAIGSHTRAAELVAEAQSIGQRHDDDRLLAHLADTEAQVALASGDADRAVVLAETASPTGGARGRRQGRSRRLDDTGTGPARARPDRRGLRGIRPRRRPRPGPCPGAAPARGPPGLGGRPRGDRAARRGVCPGARGARRRSGPTRRAADRVRGPDRLSRRQPILSDVAPPLNRTSTRSFAVP